jgi:choline dehydrogenase
MMAAVPTERNADADFSQRARANQERLASQWHTRDYDFIVCGAGTSGSVVARRLAEHPDVRVLLLEAGGSDDDSAVQIPDLWPTNLGTDRDWCFSSEPNLCVNNRELALSMGKGLGGGSSINVMLWARGHKTDWDFYASDAGEPAWNYESVLKTYRTIEDWHGDYDGCYRGTGGPVFVAPARNPHPLARAIVDGARSLGIANFPNPNGRLMEAAAGGAISDLRIRFGIRESIYRSYVHPFLDRPNLTVLTDAQVRRITFDGNVATGVEVRCRGSVHVIRAQAEVVLSMGTVNTPKVLMQSGVGDQTELTRAGVPVLQHLPGVGANFQDHVGLDCVWQFREAPPPNGRSEAVVFWNNGSRSISPDMFACLGTFPHASAENAARYGLPDDSWILFGGISHPESRGRVLMTGSDPDDRVRIEANTLCEPADLESAIACVEFMREIGNSAEVQPFVQREVMPGNLSADELKRYVRDAASTYWHGVGTAKMGRDAMSVVDADLKVYGIDDLRVADASILPRLPTSNTMAPCVIVGERAAAAIEVRHGLMPSLETTED